MWSWIVAFVSRCCCCCIRADPISSMACVNAKRLPCSATPADPVSKVLDDDNLLIEIIVRLGFPTTLVRASLVCKRWFCHASDPAFLRRFRKLHPPRPLGFYIAYNRPFFMLPQPPELAAVARRAASYSFEAYHNVLIGGCDNNGRILIRGNYNSTFGAGPSSSSRRIQFGEICSPLCPERAVPIVPHPPHDLPKESNGCTFFKQGGQGLFYFCFFEDQEEGKMVARVYMFKDGVWFMHTSAETRSPYSNGPCFVRPVLVGNKIYIPTSDNDILVLDLRASSFSKIQLPHGVQYGEMKTFFSPDDDDSRVYLIHARNFQLHIWLSNGENWLLVDVICLREMYANLRISDHTCEDDYTVRINEVGENAEFAFLHIGRSILYMDIKCRIMRKVYDMTVNDRFYFIYPLMMIWPPTFPVLKDDSSRFTFWPFGYATIIRICVVLTKV